MEVVKVETIYRVGDKIFENREDAEQFLIRDPEMYELDEDFKLTSDVISAVVINLESKLDIIKFVTLNKNYGYDTNGITENSKPGWYFYDGNRERFVKAKSKESAFSSYLEKN